MKKNFVIGALCVTAISTMFLVGCGNNKVEKQKTNTVSEKILKLDTISENDVLKNIDNKDYVFVDTRNDSYYNGFKQGNELKGGHIKGAVQYTADWIGKVNPKKLPKFVEDKGILKNKKIVVYDSNKENIDKVGSMLKKLGYEVYAFNDFDKFVNDKNTSLVKFKRYGQLINPQILKSLMDKKTPETFKNNNYMIFEVSWGPINGAKDYKEGHIPGSYHFNTDWIENGPDWNLSSPDRMNSKLTQAGIDKNKTIILYSSSEPSAAFRVFFALKYAGVKDVRVLNGGLDSWKEAGYNVESKINKPAPVNSFEGKIPGDPSIDVSTPKDAMKLMKEKGLKLISIRSWDEYSGKVSGYDYIPTAGEPKGAIWGFAGSDAHHMEHYFDPDGTLRNPLEMVKLWKSVGINENDKGAFYCGTSWRATIPWEMTQMLGMDSFVIFDGGWNMWQMDKNLPIQKGAPNNMKMPDPKNDWK